MLKLVLSVGQQVLENQFERHAYEHKSTVSKK